MATYGNTGGNGLNINVYSGSGGNLSEWALDYDGMKLLTIPEVITASNITTNQAVTVTLKAKPIFTNITVSFFRVKFPDGTIAEYPATNNSAVFTTTVTAPLGSQQTLLVYARDNSGNRSAVAQHQYTIINSNPPSTNTITHNIPSNYNAGDVKQIQISGAVDPEGDAYTYTLILPEEISGSKISGISNNETVTLTVQNTIQYTRTDKIIIRVTDINGAQNDKVLDITMLSGGSSGGTNNFNVRTSFPSSVYQNEVFAAKIWELGTNNYTYGLNLPNGITSSKTTGILSNENFTITIAPSVIPNSTVSIDVVVYTGSVSVGSFVVNMLVDGVTGEMSYTTPGTYEFTVPNSVDSISMLQVYSNKINTVSNDKGGFLLKNLVKDNILTNSTFNWPTMPEGDYLYQMNNMIYCIQGYTVTYTLDNFDTVLTATLPGNESGIAHRHLSAYGNGSYIVTGRVDNSPVNTYLSVNNGLTWSRVETASFTGATSHANLDYFNSVFYIVKSEANGGNLVSIDGGYNFIDKPLPTAYRNCVKPVGGVKVTKDGYFRLMHNLQGDNKLHLIKTTDRCDTWKEVPITNTSNEDSNAFLHYVNEKYFIISQRSDNLVMWVSSDLLSWETKYISKGSMGAADPTYTYDASVIGTEFFYNNDSYYISYILKTKNLTRVLYKRINDELNTVNSCLLLKNNPNGIAIYDGVFFSLLDSRYVPPSESNAKITQGIYLAGDRDTYNHDYLSTYDSFGPVNQDVEFFICNNELVCYSDKVFGDSSYYVYVPPAPPPPPPPPSPTWWLIPGYANSSLSRIPDVYGDTKGIFLNVYQLDPKGTFIHNDIRYSSAQRTISFDTWRTYGNKAVILFNIYASSGDIYLGLTPVNEAAEVTYFYS